MCECRADVIRLEAGNVAECYLMDGAWLEKIREFFRIG